MVAHLVAALPARDSSATAQIIKSFGDGGASPTQPESTDGSSTTQTLPEDPRRPSSTSSRISLDHAFFRDDFFEAASSYIIRSEATGTRTVVNYNGLDEMTVQEFMGAATRFLLNDGDGAWFHFEVRVARLHASDRSDGDEADGQ